MLLNPKASWLTGNNDKTVVSVFKTVEQKIASKIYGYAAKRNKLQSMDKLQKRP
jgi:hypothetical protein